MLLLLMVFVLEFAVLLVCSILMMLRVLHSSITFTTEQQKEQMSPELAEIIIDVRIPLFF